MTLNMLGILVEQEVEMFELASERRQRDSCCLYSRTDLLSGMSVNVSGFNLDISGFNLDSSYVVIT